VFQYQVIKDISRSNNTPVEKDKNAHARIQGMKNSVLQNTSFSSDCYLPLAAKLLAEKNACTVLKC